MNWSHLKSVINVYKFKLWNKCALFCVFVFVYKCTIPLLLAKVTYGLSRKLDIYKLIYCIVNLRNSVEKNKLETRASFQSLRKYCFQKNVFFLFCTVTYEWKSIWYLFSIFIQSTVNISSKLCVCLRPMLITCYEYCGIIDRTKSEVSTN